MATVFVPIWARPARKKYSLIEPTSSLGCLASSEAEVEIGDGDGSRILNVHTLQPDES